MPQRPSLLKRLVVPSLILILLSVAALDWYAARAFRQFHFKQLESNLEAVANLVRLHLSQEHYAPLDYDQLAKDFGKNAGLRVTLVSRNGRVLGDSSEELSKMENQATRPEIAAALRGEKGTSERFNSSLDESVLYVAIPFYNNDMPVAVIRVAVSLEDVKKTLRDMNFEIALGGLVVALIAIIVALIITRRITKPLEELQSSAQKFAGGDLSTRFHVPDIEELATLAMSMNSMAAQLDERVRTISRQQEEQEAVLAGMVEAVIAVDANERVLIVNRAAAALFHFDPQRAVGRSIQEVARSSEVQKIVNRAIHSNTPVESEITLFDPVERVLQASGTSLRDSSGKLQGAVVVLNDITPIRRVERTRRDFVSNAGHELKTPITSIKGFIETLRDGAIENRADAERFLGIIARQADHLAAIVEDLLSLARIERETEHQLVQLEITDIRGVLDEAVFMCHSLATAKNQLILIQCDEALTANANAQMLKQAVVNLVDNAVKYSPEGTKILVDAVRNGKEIVVSVTDKGPGISPDHLPRLFERFYRIDKSRNRKLGGTGLGLAIVKHIAAALGGSVGVESTPGKGSTFTIRWPG